MRELFSTNPEPAAYTQCHGATSVDHSDPTTLFCPGTRLQIDHGEMDTSAGSGGEQPRI